MNSRIKKRICVFAILFVAAAVIIFLFPERIKAVFREEDAVHIHADDIENATLIIGTHLIYLGAMTDYLYETANRSAQEAGQKKMYYKSELSDGKWYSLSNATSLKDITTKGKDVSKSEIEKLFMTHHTKSDGITYNLKEEKPVSVYDIVSPYQLEGLRELAPLVNLKQLNEKGAALFELEVKDTETKLCDSWIKKLSQTAAILKEAGASKEQLATLDTVMEKADARRRNIVFRKVESELSKLLDEDGGADAEFNSAVSQAIAGIEDSILDSDSKMLGDGTTVMTQAEARLDKELITAAGAELEPSDNEPGDETDPDLAACDAIVSKLQTLRNIMDGRSAAPEAEIKLLTEMLIPMAEEAYQNNPTEAGKNELEYYRAQKTQRESAAGGSFQEELNNLYGAKEQLKEERLSALDQENLAEAKRLEALIEEKNSQIRDQEDRISKEAAALMKQKTQLADKLNEARLAGAATAELENQMTALESKINNLNNGVDAESMAQSIQSMNKEALAIIESLTAGGNETDNMVRLSEAVAAIGAMCGASPRLAGSALESVYQKMAAEKFLTDTKQYDSLLDRIEELLSENKTVLNNTMDESAVLDCAKEAAGGDAPAMLMGLSMFCEQTAAGGMDALVEKQAETLTQNKDSFVFPKARDAGGKPYVPADKAAAYASYRYVWNENKKRATLAGRKNYYIFTAFDSMVTRGKDIKEQMSAPALFQTTVYIPADYAGQEFGCEVYDIPGTGYCILINQSRKDQAAEVLNALLRKGD